MEQHVIQKSWIKQFASRGQVLRVEFDTLSSEPKKPREIAFIDDLQSRQNELEDSKIENAISILHDLKGGLAKLSGENRDVLDRWVALHLSRSFREIEHLSNSTVEYSRARVPLINDSIIDVSSYLEVWVASFGQEDEPLVLSDNPVIRLKDDALLIPFGCRKLIAFSNIDLSKLIFEGRKWPEAVNEMSYQNSEYFLICNPHGYPDLSELRARSRKNIFIEEKNPVVRIRAN